MSGRSNQQGSKASLPKAAAGCRSPKPFTGSGADILGVARLGLRQPAAAFHSTACCGIFLLLSLLPTFLPGKDYVYDPVERFNAKSFQELCQDTAITKMDLLRAGLVDKDMPHLANLPNLVELRIDSHRLTPTGYAVLAKLPKLQKLSVHMTSGKELDAIFGFIQDHRLEELDLTNCRDFTGQGLERLNHKANLRRLTLSCFRGTLNDEGLESLQGFTGLRHLDLSQHNQIKKSIRYLENMPELETLNLYGCVGIEDRAATQAFAKLPKLKELNMGFCWAHKGGGLVFPKNLQNLNLIESKSLTDAAFQNFPCRDTLVEANLYQCLPLTDKGIATFQNLPKLQKLNIGCIRALTNQSLRYVGTNPLLTHLTLCDNDQFTDEGLQHLSNLKNLHALNLWHTKGLTGSGLQHVTSLPKLTELNLSDCHNLQGKHFQHLPKIKSLRILYLDNSLQLQDPDLAHLQNLPLAELTLSGCENLTDNALLHLAKIQTLQYLDISNIPGLSDEGRHMIRKALPGCEIVM